MVKPSRHTPQLIEEYVTRGYWHPEAITDFWDRNAALYPDKEAIVDSRARLTWRQAKQQIDRVALGLIEMGFHRDEVIAFQLYNCVEVFTLRLACQKAGIIPATMMPTFRHAEVEAILRRTKARGMVIPREYRKFDFFQMVQEVRPRLPDLKHIFVIGDDAPAGTISINKMIQRPLEGAYPSDYLERTKIGPYEVGSVMTTSGTTGLPKLSEYPVAAQLFSGRVYIERLKLTPEDVLAGIAPVVGGAGSTLLFSAAPQVVARIALLERFDPEDAFRFIERERVTGCGIVPAQLALMVSHSQRGKYDLTSLRFMQSGTALLPPSLGLEVEKVMGCRIVQNCGTIETGSAFSSSLDDPLEVRVGTVGRPVTGTEVKLVDEKGVEVAPGEVGQVSVRGPACCGGLFNSPEASAQTWKSGWIVWEDLARFDDGGNLVLVGRKSDTIIRGGQNIYPKEIEDILVQHPSVMAAAVVRMPDRVMGEKACAYVVTRPGARFSFKDMTALLSERKLATYKLPERLEIVTELPLRGEQKVDKRTLEKDIAQKLSVESAT